MTELDRLLRRIADGDPSPALLDRARALLRMDTRLPEDLREIGLEDDEPAIAASALLGVLGLDDGLFGGLLGEALRSESGAALPWESAAPASSAEPSAPETVTAAMLEAQEAAGLPPVADAVRAEAGEISLALDVLRALDVEVIDVGAAVSALAGEVDISAEVATRLGALPAPLQSAVRAEAGEADVSAVVGGLVSVNERLAQLVDPAALEVVFRVSTPQYARFLGDGGRLVGADVTARIDVLGVDLEARGNISRESAAVGEGQTGRQLFAQIGDAPGFRPGDFVSVAIEEPPLDRVARLPATAVDANGRVLVVADEDRLEVGEVEVLRREGDDVIVRARGLSDRELVAAQTPLLGAGIRIRPIRPGNAQAPEEPEMLALEPERRARLVAFVEANARMPAEVKSRILGQLQDEKVPAQVVERIESRMGG
ncbi:MAG: efflux transporter periplasmic adaptor subunit [Pseudomonadota bacterium]